jgi:hypothetical protein
MPEQAKRHHVVSKFYLRYFANDEELVTTVVLPGDRTFPQSIGDASVRTGYYTVIDQEGHRATRRSRPSRSWRRSQRRHGVKWRQGYGRSLMTTGGAWLLGSRSNSCGDPACVTR